MNFYKIDKLREGNYIAWAYRVQLLMQKEDIQNGLLDEVEEIEDSESEEAKKFVEWKKRQQRAMEIIAFTVSDDQLVHIKRSELGGQAWRKLKEHHCRVKESTRVQLMTLLLSTDQRKGENMVDHFNKLWNLMDRLREIDGAPPEPYAVAIILKSVRETHKSLVTAISAWPEERLTIRNIK